MSSLFSTLLFCISLFAGAMILVGCNQSAPTNSVETAKSSSKAVNEVCPIMGSKVSKKAKTVEWNGKTIGFCCDGCDEKFMALSDEEKAEKLAAAEAKAKDDTDHEDHQSGDHDHS